MTNIIIYVTVSIALSAIPIFADANFDRNAVITSMRLYSEAIKGRDNENVVFSPLSIQTALGLVFLGANGITGQEIAESLGLGTADRNAVADYYHELLKVYSRDGSGSLNIANKIYMKNDAQLKREFHLQAAHLYAEGESINFGDSTAAANKINTWVGQRTNNKIKNLFTPNDLDPTTQMIIVNAVYFKGLWKSRFNSTLTQSRPFYVNPASQPIDVVTMGQKLTVRTTYIDALKSMAIELPYKDSDLSMVIILPNEKNGLRYLEEKLPQVNLLKIVADMHLEDNVRLEIPKFKIDFSIVLNQALYNLGAQTMFSDNADFSNLFDGAGRLKVSNVVHKAFIDVNEEGTEAAASTGIGIQLLSANTFDRFIVDHPFFYAIMSRKGVVFAGRVIDPRI